MGAALQLGCSQDGYAIVSDFATEFLLSALYPANAGNDFETLTAPPFDPKE